MTERVAFRHEVKSLISRKHALQLRTVLRPLLQPDPHAGPDGTYRVRSLYFDDPRDSALLEKEAGIGIRTKYRLRLYDHDPDTLRLECKGKEGEMVRKRTLPLSRDQALALLSGEAGMFGLGAAADPAGDGLLWEFLLARHRGLLRPASLVDYQREAFVHPATRVRMTLDTELAAPRPPLELFDGGLASAARALPDSSVILELKFDRYVPESLARLLDRVPKIPMALSKYALCRRRSEHGIPAWPDMGMEERQDRTWT